MPGKTGVVLALYQVASENEKALLKLLPKKRRYFLKAGYATRRAPILLRSRQNPDVFIEVFEWKSPKAVAKAHKDPIPHFDAVDIY